MNDESLEGTLWAFEQEMASLEELLISFLKTRKEVFPKFALVPEPKLKSIFCSRSTDNINNWYHIGILLTKMNTVTHNHTFLFTLVFEIGFSLLLL
jgi:hypothetical protein